MSGMNSKNCCKSCPGDAAICCLKGTFVGGAFDGREIFFTKRSSGLGGVTTSVWEFGETCSETDGSGKCNNASGYLYSAWNTYTDESDPFRAFLGCMPNIHIKWMPDTAECKVKMFLGGSGSGNGRLFIAQGWNCGAEQPAEWPYDQYLGSIWTLGYSAYNLNSNWHTGTVTLTDWRYMKLHDLNPDDYPLPAPTFTIEACPVRDNFEPVDNDNIRFFYKWQYRDLDDTTGEAEGDWLDTGLCGVIEGDCMCLTSAVGTGGFGGTSGATFYGFNWPDRVYFGNSGWLGLCSHCLPADLSCSWYDDLPEFLECPNEYGYYDPEAVRDPYYRIVFTKLGAEEEPPECIEEGTEPTGEEEYCFRQSLCLQLAFNLDTETGDYESEVQCYMLWDEDLDRYHIAACDSAENDCSTLVEIHEIVPTETCSSDEGYREWEVTILITSISTAFELYSDTFRVCLKCGSHWSIMQHIELEDTTTIDLRIGTTCATVPTPPPCDPLCWPECVLCPTPLAMSLVVTQDPSCCLHGSYGLTYNSGSNWFTLTSAPVGGPSGVCGKITAFKMTCSDSTHVTLAITYENVNGSTISSTTTVSANCTGGDFETDTVTVISGLFAPGLCEGGLFLGAKFRVVGI